MSNLETEKPEEKEPSLGDLFMLAQFSEMNQDWRHYDQRISTALNIYLAVWAFILATEAALSNVIRAAELFLPTLIVSALILYLVGFFVVRRVNNSTISRDRRRAAANRAQDYFVRRAPEVSPYVPSLGRVPKLLRSALDNQKERGESYEVSFPDGIVHTINTLNALLSSLFVAGLSVLFFESNLFWIASPPLALVIFFLHLQAYADLKSHHHLKKK